MVGLKKQEKDPDPAPRPPGSPGTCFKWALYNNGRWLYTLWSRSESWSGCCGHLQPVPPSRARAFILCVAGQEEAGLLFSPCSWWRRLVPNHPHHPQTQDYTLDNRSGTHLQVFLLSQTSPHFTSQPPLSTRGASNRRKTAAPTSSRPRSLFKLHVSPPGDDWSPSTLTNW